MLIHHRRRLVSLTAAIIALACACSSPTRPPPTAAAAEGAVQVPPGDAHPLDEGVRSEASPNGPADAARPDTTAIGLQCPKITTTRPAPHAVTIRVRNVGATTVYLRRGCVFEYQISSCAGGFVDELQKQIRCFVCPCSMPTCAPACPGCAEDQGHPLAPNATQDLVWNGVHEAITKPQGCQSDVNMPAGLYRVRVPIYAAPDAAVARQSPRVWTKEFELPADAIIELPVHAEERLDAGAADGPGGP